MIKIIWKEFVIFIILIYLIYYMVHGTSSSLTVYNMCIIIKKNVDSRSMVYGV